jgi:RNA polymerase sigma factor (sigma-70 family)
VQPWTEGRRKIESRLHGWRQEYSPSVHDNALESDGEECQQILKRQLNCWVYHWHTAGEEADGYAVATSIEQGTGFQGNGDLGGNPLFDVCLAVAVTCGHSRAAACFEEQHFQDSKKDAAKLAEVFEKEDAMDWWSGFLVALSGSHGKRAKLESFDGRVGLRRWLKIVRCNYLRNLLRERNRLAAREQALPESLCDRRVAEVPMEQQETLAILTDIFRAAYKQLEPDAAVILAMVYKERLTNLQVASLLGINPGTATRRRQKSEDRFRELLSEQMQARGESLQSLGDLVAGMRADFASLLFEILGNDKPQQRDDEPSSSDQEGY